MYITINVQMLVTTILLNIAILWVLACRNRTRSYKMFQQLHNMMYIDDRQKQVHEPGTNLLTVVGYPLELLHDHLSFLSVGYQASNK